MSRQLNNHQRALIPANRPMRFDGPNTSERTRVFLVMVSHDLLPAIFHENKPLQRMRTIRVEPDESPWLEPSQPVTGPPPEMTPAVRKLLRDPGEWRVVCWGDFKDMLGAQLSHPERLRDSHRLTCYVQVYEITKPQRIESIAREVFGKPDSDRELCPLTPAIANKLQLIPLLQSRPHIPLQMRREPGLLLPNDRLFRLQLISDPTADREALAQNQSQTDSPLPPPVKRSAIPERYLKPWEFQLSREEALYDVKLDGPFNHLIRLAKVWLQGRRQFQKWRALLSGKNLEEQLWLVRPPKGAISNPSVQEWARATLEKAGYDSDTMLIEWQVYWRRKGLS